MSCCSSMKNTFPILEGKTPKKKRLLNSIAPYKPLIVMILCVLAGSVVLSQTLHHMWMPLFMGLFLLNFAMFKLFDVKGFAQSFAMYDVVAKRSNIYALAYPFIELGLALCFLGHWMPYETNFFTAIIMAVGLVGILSNKLSGKETRCACMGSLIDVPVGSITILENSSMALMALYSLITI
jgi:hypothetical protein